MVFFNDQNYNLCLALRLHDADWATYNLWFDNDNNKPEWRGCSIQELREDLEDMISCLDKRRNKHTAIFSKCVFFY